MATTTKNMQVVAGNANASVTAQVTDSMPGVPCPGPAGYTYKGLRYVPVFADPIEWNSANSYEALTIVVHEGNSYTSKQTVPVGVDIANETFWALTGNYNAQIEQYRKEVADLATSLKFDYCKCYSNVAEMKADTEIESNMLLHTDGYYTVGDGGASWYTVEVGSTANEMGTIQLQNGFIAEIITNNCNAFNVAQLGLVPTLSDCSAIFQKIMDTYCPQTYNSTGEAYFYFGVGSYNFNSPITINSGAKIIGSGNMRVSSIDSVTTFNFANMPNTYECAITVTSIEKSTGAHIQYPTRYAGTDIDNGNISISQNILIENITITGNNTSEMGVYCVGVLSSEFKNVSIRNFKNGISTSAFWYNAVRNLDVRASQIGIILMNSTNQNQFENIGSFACTDQSTQYNIALFTTPIRACCMYINYTEGFNIDMLDIFSSNPNAVAIYSLFGRSINISSLFAEGLYSYIIECSSCSNFYINSGWLYINYGDSTVKAFMLADGFNQVSIGISSTILKPVEKGTGYINNSVIYFENTRMFSDVEGVYTGASKYSGNLILYVDSANGNDNNTGTEVSSPLKSIDVALQTAKIRNKQTSIVLSEGTYTLSGVFNSSFIYIQKQSTADKSNVILNINSTTLVNALLLMTDITINVKSSINTNIVSTMVLNNCNVTLADNVVLCYGNAISSFANLTLTNGTVVNGSNTSMLMSAAVIGIFTYYKTSSSTVNVTEKGTNVRIVTVS